MNSWYFTRLWFAINSITDVHNIQWKVTSLCDISFIRRKNNSNLLFLIGLTISASHHIYDLSNAIDKRTNKRCWTHPHSLGHVFIILKCCTCYRFCRFRKQNTPISINEKTKKRMFSRSYSNKNKQTCSFTIKFLQWVFWVLFSPWL
jgi:hypothetical protein